MHRALIEAVPLNNFVLNDLDILAELNPSDALSIIYLTGEKIIHFAI